MYCKSSSFVDTDDAVVPILHGRQVIDIMADMNEAPNALFEERNDAEIGQRALNVSRNSGT